MIGERKVYIATRLENARAHNDLRDALATLSVRTTYDWTTHGRVKDSAVQMCYVATGEMRGIREADCVVALLPGGRGTHVEIGAALALRIPVVLFDPDGSLTNPGEETCAFYHHPGIVEVVAERDTSIWDRRAINLLVAAVERAIEEARS